ncbi:MAG: hypothetical protein J5769_06410 [Bacteroidales bacterium]|nr:hypothetical protein [Bacteroidales bacterium]
MRYIIRALKYFVQVSVTMGLILLILMAAGLVSTDVNVAFQHGWRSVGIIAVMFGVVSAIYPVFGYSKRMVNAKGEPATHRDAIIGTMESRGYKLEKEADDGSLYFRLRSFAAQLFRLWEDRVSINPVLGGFTIEGLTRDISRIASNLEFKINRND